MSTRTRAVFLTTIVVQLLTYCAFRSHSAEINNLTFRDIAGNLYSNVTILKLEKDAVLFRYEGEARYGRVKFTNMTEQVQLQCGYDAKKLAQERAEKAAIEKREAEIATESALAVLREHQEVEISLLASRVTIIKPVDFLKTDSTKATCKEIAAEINGLNKAIELGLNHAKYAELVTDTAIKIEKTKDLSNSELPPVFLVLADKCLKSHKEARDEWSHSIKSSDESVKKWREYFLQSNWAEARIHYTLLYGIIEGRTNANNLAIEQAIKLVRREGQAIEDGTVPRTLQSFGHITGLSKDEILKRLKKALSYDTEPNP